MAKLQGMIILIPSGTRPMTRHFLMIRPLDKSFLPTVESQRQACEVLADAYPYRSGRCRGGENTESFPSVGDIDFNEHSEETLANPYYTDQTRFSITIDNHRDLLGESELAQLESLLACRLLQSIIEY